MPDGRRLPSCYFVVADQRTDVALAGACRADLPVSGQANCPSEQFLRRFRVSSALRRPESCCTREPAPEAQAPSAGVKVTRMGVKIRCGSAGARINQM